MGSLPSKKRTEKKSGIINNLFKVCGVTKSELGCTIEKYHLGIFLTTGAKYDGIDEKDNCITALHYGADQL